MHLSIEQKEGDKFKKTINWIFALQKTFENKKLGLAVGTHNEKENIAYELGSEIETTDKLKIIPVIL